MMTAGSVGTRSAATKRLMKEYAELQSSPNYQYAAAPLEDNMFDWHFTIRGPQDSEFENGIYHGRIVLPPQYPYKPPSIYFLTPNGRFELGKKICLSITGYHPETWLPAWGIRTALIALISFMTTEGKDAVGALDYTPEERRILAKKSHAWHCDICGCKNCDQLLPIPKNEMNDQKEQDEHEDHNKLAEMLVVSGEKKNNQNEQDTDTTTQTNVNNNTSQIPITENNNVNQTEPEINNITQMPSPPSTNINTNNVEVNASSVQQRVPTTAAVESEKSNSMSTSTTSTPSTSNNTTSNTTPSSTPANLSRNNSQANIDQNLINEERYKSFIDTMIIIVFGLLACLVYYRINKDAKFWNSLE